jgi:hypothetical protein
VACGASARTLNRNLSNEGRCTLIAEFGNSEGVMPAPIGASPMLFLRPLRNGTFVILEGDAMPGQPGIWSLLGGGVQRDLTTINIS